MNASKINILFLLSISRKNKKGECAIRCRITFLKQRKEFATGLFIKEERWNNKKQLVIGKNSESLNNNLLVIKQKIDQVYLQFLASQQEFSVEDIFLKYNGEDDTRNKTLLSVFTMHLEKMHKLTDIEYSIMTIRKYETVFNQLKDFIKWKYNKNDVFLSELKLVFLTDFEFYLKTEIKQKQVTANKTIQRIKTIVKTAIAEGYLMQNPFMLYKPKKVSLHPVFLSTEELELLQKYQFKIDRLTQVRDCYIFCCYTGLPYLEMASLKKENIIKGFDGKLWISMYRQKTSKELMIPLLPQAKAILDLYASNDTEELLPIISNQKFNSYLKEIAEIVGINKNLTHHTARKTFASTVLLYNNVPIEVVSELLGHSKITVTQEHYGRVVKKRVSEEIQKLLNKT